MLSVMIVEDEPLVRIGLKSIVNWDKLDLRVDLDAADGAEALAAFEKNRHDIVITDIKMPRMNGLELMRAIRKLDRQTRFIVLTCLDEFDMLRQAIEFDITAYLLKLSSGLHDIENALQKAIRELSALRGHSLPQRGVDLSVVEDQLLRDFIVTGAIRADDFLCCMDRINVRLPKGRVCLATFALPEGIALSETAEDPFGYKLHRAAVNMLKRKLDEVGRGRVLFDGVSHFIALLDVEDGPVKDECEACAAIVEQLAGALRQSFNAGVRAAVSDVSTSFEEWPERYGEAVQRLKSASILPYKVAAVTMYIAHHYMKPISILDAANHLGISSGYLSHMLLRHQGLTFGEMLNRFRIEKAKKLLVQPNAQVYEVASAVGIPNATYFTRIFRRYVGQGPRDYRKELGF